jgi:hypothetical protein
MKKYIKWGAVILVLVSLLVFNFALIFERNNQRVAATPLAPGEPAQTDIYVGNVVHLLLPAVAVVLPRLGVGRQPPLSLPVINR